MVLNYVLVKLIKDWFIFCNVNDLRSFFGIILYYCCFVKGFVDIGKVLYKFIEKVFFGLMSVILFFSVLKLF